MTKTFSRRHFLKSALAGGTAMATAPVWAEAPLTSLRPTARAEDLLKRFQPSADNIVAQAKLGGRVTFAVSDVATGDVLESSQAATGQPPASVAKAMTAAFALEVLGPEHRFTTRLIATGEISEGVLKGDLILAGGGDPTLDTDALAGLARSLKEAGVTSVEGKFGLWGGALPFVEHIDAGQPAHVGYSPAVSGLNLNFNRVHFEWRRSGDRYNITMEGRSETHRPAVSFAKMKVVPRSLPIYTYENMKGFDQWTVAKGALGNGGARWLPVRKPELYAGEVLHTFARAHGISLSRPVVLDKLPDGKDIAGHNSAPLRDILRGMLKWSTNLTAEVVGMTATAALSGKPPTSLEASAKAMNDWAKEKFGLRTMAFVDHSGLGDRSRISAQDMMTSLLALRSNSELKALLKPFHMRDDNRKIIKDHPLTVLAKTGTLNFVSGLAGFVDLPDGRELAFAIFAANLDRRAGLTMAEKERPEGGAAWNRRAKKLQQALIERWGVLYTA